MDHLEELEHRSIYLIREAYHRFDPLGCLWSMGKDSTVLLHLVRKAFLGKFPFPVLHLDTGYKLAGIYRFRDRIAAEWGVPLVVVKNEAALAAGMGPDSAGRLACCTALKTEALKGALAEHGFRAVLLGIRRDEHGVRAKERYVSPRTADFTWDAGRQTAELWDLYARRESEEAHLRVHPLLHFTEADVWRYVRRERLPVCDLYFAKGGRRYRSIGCEPCCEPVASNAATVDDIIREIGEGRSEERDGRAQDKENARAMEQLRALGYM
ncbi:MAG TPA: sulfate adenylyltransferase subunit CysD [Planctomycetota bacterium]|jgi:sulfate adenylyltransferase subunit 2|nr:sulfate adenylyltransferase subunit CysD [Planctomycetota bacterium]OQC19797.1 MAG: Sulfate adenylyltransferase subunit 2 [Planctomycetes bacterium ADurb.Bin069]HNR99032.1 sulfate adenylyltransferase subunit CysD [Planctomycetota bacterium]HNU27262.1 sulfate adenylyltransferase subunit CysD [Planctomycetota bacterium]HOE30215.1 sulfate adenylyltransferase subunit CysD [Planctomycetota bacterium]